MCSFLILLFRFECFALQNLQANNLISNYKVTKVNVFTKLKSNFIVRISLYIIYGRIRSCRGRANVQGITKLFVDHHYFRFAQIEIFWSSCVDDDSIKVAIKSEHLNKRDVSVLEYE